MTLVAVSQLNLFLNSQSATVRNRQHFTKVKPFPISGLPRSASGQNGQAFVLSKTETSTEIPKVEKPQARSLRQHKTGASAGQGAPHKKTGLF